MAKQKHYHQWERVQRTPIPDGERRRQEANKARLNSEEFQRFCLFADVEPTTRQASKFNNRKGAAYRLSKGLI